MKIGNIIFENELVNHSKVEYINYINEATSYDELDKTLPTLYVGWSFMKECNPNNEIIQNANILHKKIIQNELFWECSFKESKSSHIKGTESFVNSVPQFYFTPKYKVGEYKCQFVCMCFGDHVIEHNPPLFYNIAKDPAEDYLIDINSSPRYQKIYQKINKAVELHKKSITYVESQFSFSNTIWR